MSTEHNSHQKVHRFLRQHPVGVLSTVDADGKPWGSAVYYVADAEFNFYFVTRVETFKFENVAARPFAALTIADPVSQVTVQVAGEITKVPVHEYMATLFDKLATIRPTGDYNWTPPISKLHAGNFMPLQLTPTKLQYADFQQKKSDIRADYIEHILPA
jgi:nitroimidazol reductase NimA-like FMN-containing flavoprotein (pyridoxamine 5'-phosphate oxidase superfamily)